MDISRLVSPEAKVKLHLALKHYPKLGAIAKACTNVEDQWRELPYIRQKRLQELWRKIVGSEVLWTLTGDEQKDAVDLIVNGAGDDCYPLYEKGNICDAIFRQIKLSAHADAIDAFARCIWEAWSENTTKQQTLCNYLGKFGNISSRVAVAIKRGVFRDDFPVSCGKDCPQDRLVLIEDFLKRKIGSFFDPPSIAVTSIAWKFSLHRYTKLVTYALSNNSHYSYSLKDVISFIEQDSLLNGMLRNPSALREFAEAVLSPFKSLATQNFSQDNNWLLSNEFEDVKGLLVDLFEKILGPIREAHLTLSWEKIEEDLRALLDFWDKGRKLNNLFAIASKAWRLVAASSGEKKLVAWDKRKNFWMRIWAKGYIYESRIFVPENLRGALMNQYRAQSKDIYVVKNAAQKSAVLAMKFCVDKHKALAVEFNNCGPIRIFDITNNQLFDFTNKTELNVRNNLDDEFNKSKFPDSVYKISHKQTDWEFQTKNVLGDILEVRII